MAWKRVTLLSLGVVFLSGLATASTLGARPVGFKLDTKRVTKDSTSSETFYEGYAPEYKGPSWKRWFYMVGTPTVPAPSAPR